MDLGWCPPTHPEAYDYFRSPDSPFLALCSDRILGISAWRLGLAPSLLRGLDLGSICIPRLKPWDAGHSALTRNTYLTLSESVISSPGPQLYSQDFLSRTQYFSYSQNVSLLNDQISHGWTMTSQLPLCMLSVGPQNKFPTLYFHPILS